MAKGNDLRQRTKTFAAQVIWLVSSFPRMIVTDTIGKQLLRCATSVGANYRAACRAQSQRDFVAKLAIVIEECDETQYWPELLREEALIAEDQFTRLHKEADELLSIFVASRKTSMQSRSKRP